MFELVYLSGTLTVRNGGNKNYVTKSLNGISFNAQIPEIDKAL